MTNEELDTARVKEAQRLFLDGSDESPTILIAARLAREGWTPPVAVDPDLAEARALASEVYESKYPTLAWKFRNGTEDKYETITGIVRAIKRGRELERAEAQPGMVWKEHDGSDVCPVDPNSDIWIKHSGRTVLCAADLYLWKNVTHYCEIPQPEDAA